MDKDASEIAKLTERILKDPKSKLFVPLAEEYKKIGQIDMAVSVLAEGLRNNPGYATARSFLGRLLLDQGNLAGAQKELEEVVKAIPDNLLAQRKLGDIFILLGKKNEALARYKTALALNSADKDLASLVADIEAGQDVSARIPKPKSAASPAEVKKTEPAPHKGSTPPAVGVKPAAAQPVRAPGAGSASPAAITAQPLPAQKPAPAAPAPKPEEPEELVEEIMEIESLDQPPPAEEARKPPLRSAETLPPLKSAEVSQPGADAFDLSEPASSREPAAADPFSGALDRGVAPARESETLPAAENAEDNINTDTLAELYIAQGFYDKAIEIYQRMLSERPDNAVLQAKLLKLHALAGGPPPAGSAETAPEQEAPEQPERTSGGFAAVRRKETIDRLESWLKNIIKEKPE